jgi:hypothetical protein
MGNPDQLARKTRKDLDQLNSHEPPVLPAGGGHRGWLVTAAQAPGPCRAGSGVMLG